MLTLPRAKANYKAVVIRTGRLWPRVDEYAREIGYSAETHPHLHRHLIYAIPQK